MKRNSDLTGTSKIKHSIALIVILYTFWILMSGALDAKHLIMGLGTVLVTVWITLPLLHIPSEDGKRRFYAFDFPYLKYALYWVWLIGEIAKASIDVAKIVLSPKMPINPHMVQFKRKMSNPLSYATLANSITLTPGTISVDIDDGIFTVHALTDGAADGLEDGQGKMMEYVRDIFGEGH